MNVYEIVTQRVMSELEKGVIPWKKPWTVSGGMPRNYVTKRPYTGINPFLLLLEHFSSPYWLTMKQANGLGGKIRKGEKPSFVIFWKWLLKEEKDKQGNTTPEKVPLLRYYYVFNITQTEGIAWEKDVADSSVKQPLKECEKVIAQMPNRPEIKTSRDRAAYSPGNDVILMPDFKTFLSPENYYCTLFHELAHSTGHSSRLNRGGFTGTADIENYSKEELVAEMGAAFLCGHTEIMQNTVTNSAAYIQHWLEKLSKDKRLIVTAAAQAQKASDYILGIPSEEYAKAGAA